MGEICVAVAAPRSRRVRYTRAWYSGRPCSISFRTRSWLIGTEPSKATRGINVSPWATDCPAEKRKTPPGGSQNDRMASAEETLGRALEAALGPGKVRTDEGSRHTYSTDASPCSGTEGCRICHERGGRLGRPVGLSRPPGPSHPTRLWDFALRSGHRSRCRPGHDALQPDHPIRPDAAMRYGPTRDSPGRIEWIFG